MYNILYIQTKVRIPFNLIVHSYIATHPFTAFSLFTMLCLCIY